MAAGRGAASRKATSRVGVSPKAGSMKKPTAAGRTGKMVGKSRTGKATKSTPSRTPKRY